MPAALTPDQARWALEHPLEAAIDADKLDCERSLLTFVRYFWHVLEPKARPFVEGWALRAISEHLEAVSRGEIQCLLVNVPPGFSKSLLTDVFFPAWEWGPLNRPHLRYCSWSYSDHVTIRDNVKCRRLLLHPAYQKLWGDRFRLTDDVNAKVKFENDKTGFKFASSVRGVSMGERGDRKILDDPHSVREAESDAHREEAVMFFSEALPSRDNDSKSATIVIMQRVHERDVAGHILEHLANYCVLTIPMHFDPQHPIATKRHSFTGWRDPRKVPGELAFPELFPAERVETMAAAMRSFGGEYAVAGQLEQRPEPRGGGRFKEEYWRECEPHEVPTGGVTVRGWDLAATEGGGDYTSGCYLKRVNGTYYASGIFGQWGDPQPVVVECAKLDGHGTIVGLPQDPGQAGKWQAKDYLVALDGYDVRTSPESGDKETRFGPVVTCAAAGRLVFVKGPWSTWMKSQVHKFPKGAVDDGCDSLSRAYGELIQIAEPVAHVAPKVVDQGALPDFGGGARSFNVAEHLGEVAPQRPAVVPVDGPPSLFSFIGPVMPR